MWMGLREANQQFARAIRGVKAGHEVVLTERGKPVAVIRAWRRDASRDAIHRRLLAAGLISRAPQRGRLRRIRPIRIQGEPIAKTLERMRDEEEH